MAKSPHEIMIEEGLPASAIIPQEERAAAWKGRKLTKVTLAKPAGAPDEDPGTAALKAELEAKAKAAAKKRKADLKEARLIRARQGAALKPKNPAAEAATQETNMAKTTKKATTKKTAKAATTKKPAAKKAAAPKALRPAKAPAATASPRVDTVQVIADLMARPEGASMQEMVDAINVQPHPMRAKIKLVRDRLGYATTAPCKDNNYRYHARPPKKSAA